MDIRCQNCDHFYSEYEDSHSGQCRRFPPKVFTSIDVFDGSGTSDGCTSFPIVRSDEWCGEFKEIEKMVVKSGTMIDSPGSGKVMICDSEGLVLPGSSFEQ